MISIVIPAHNEESRIPRTLDEYGRFFQEKKARGEIDDFEILVVLNACKDKTLEVVQNASKKYREINHLVFERGGKGFAIIEGFKYSLKNSELIGFVDADMATPPEAFYDLIKNIGNHAGIIASRWMKKSRIKKQPFMRIITSRVFNFLTRAILFLPYTDTQCGAKLFKKKALEKIIDRVKTTGWGFDIDLIYNVRKFGKVKEHPTIWHDDKDSKLNLKKVPLLMFMSIIRLRLLNSPFKKLMSSYDNLPEWMKIHHQLK